MNQLNDVMEEHSGYLIKIAYLYVQDWGIAEDIVQDVFITYFQKSAQFRQEASLKTYLTKMTANRAKDYLRSWKYKKDMLFESIFAQSSGADEVLVQKEELAMLAQNLFKLPLKYREPLILYYYDEQSIAEIAAYLELNENTVKTRLRRAKQQLKGFFEEGELVYDEF